MRLRRKPPSRLRLRRKPSSRLRLRRKPSSRLRLRRKPSSRLRHVALLAALIVLSGCTSGDRVAPKGVGGVLRIAVLHEPASLSPLVAFTQSDIAYDQLFCQTLVRVGRNGQLVPQLVTRVPSRANGDISPSGTTLTYHLRHDVRFADGVPFTSRDVTFTFAALFDPRNRAASLAPYERIVAMEALDRYTVRIRLRKRWNAAVSTIFAAADEAYGILPAHAFGDTAITGSPWETRAFGTGPFRVVQWARGDRIVLERNPFYRPVPRLGRIVLTVIPNDQAARNALVSGAVDIAPILPVDVAPLRRRPGFRVVVSYLNGLTALTLQVVRPPTDDVRVRRAIAAALDPDALNKAAFGIERPVRSFLAPPVVTWKSQPATPPYRYDRAKAARELDAAGWQLSNGIRKKAGRTLDLLYIVDAEDAADVRQAIAVQAQLGLLGMNVQIKSFSRALYADRDGPLRGGRFNLARGTSIAGSDPEASVVTLCAQAHGGVNYGRYCRAGFERLFADQAQTADPEQRARDFDAMERLVLDDVALVPIFQYSFIVAVADRVTRYTTDFLEYPVDPQAWDVRP